MEPIVLRLNVDTPRNGSVVPPTRLAKWEAELREQCGYRDDAVHSLLSGTESCSGGNTDDCDE